MGYYKITGIRTVTYKKYNDVVLIFALKERGFWSSLFTSIKEVKVILSTESPLYKEAKLHFSSHTQWKLSESDFIAEEDAGTKVFVERNIDKYESVKYRNIELQKRKDAERKAQEESKKKEAEARKLQEQLNNAAVHKVKLSDFQAVVDPNDDFSKQMSAIAGNVNICFVTGNKRGVSDNLVNLYNKVHGYNSHKLKTISARDGQTIGLAFIKMALYFDNGDFQVNEIAAQNAYYSIAKNYLGTNNTYALPALFTLFLKKPQTLTDELYSANPDSSLVGLGGMTPSAPYRRKDRAMSNRLPIMKFLLEKFYDEKSSEYLLDKTLPYHIPTVNDIQKFLAEFNSSPYASDSNVEEIGSEYFTDIYENIEEQLDL